jgi:hypothetical protein
MGKINLDLSYKRAMMALKSLTCIKIPGARPILTQGLLFKQTWWTPIRRCFMFHEEFLSFYYTHIRK